MAVLAAPRRRVPHCGKIPGNNTEEKKMGIRKKFVKEAASRGFVKPFFVGELFLDSLRFFMTFRNGHIISGAFYI